MRITPFVFALLTALCWGAAPLFGKVGLVRMDPTVAMTLRSFVISVLLLLWMVVTGGLGQFTGIDLRSGLLIGAEGIFASLLGHLGYYYALKFGQASRVVPVASAFPLVALIGAILVLGERLTWSKGMGVVFIVAGVLLMKR